MDSIDSLRLRSRAIVVWWSICLAVAAGLHFQPTTAAEALPPPPLEMEPIGDPVLGLVSVKLWRNGTPGAVGDAIDDIPSLTIFRPYAGTSGGAAVVIAPGGTYLGLAGDLEGREVADWFASRGVTAFVLRYRLGSKYLMPRPLLDAQRAIRFVRAHATELGIRSDRIGMMGFSAGGHLAALVATQREVECAYPSDPIDCESAHPNFLVVGYPALSMFDPAQRSEVAYCKKMNMTVGCDERFLLRYSPERHVGRDAPPTFIYHTTDDALVPVEDSVSLYLALTRAGVSAEMHLYRTGRHGSGLGGASPAINSWPSLLEAWLRGLGLLDPVR